MRTFLIPLLIALTGPLACFAQLTTPMASQKCRLTQTIGIAEVSVVYHRPKVNDREIFGGIVPLSEDGTLSDGSIPWRAGANENTVVSFDQPVKIAGKSLDAGTYGLHMIPSKGDWTIIFSENTSSWGSYFYQKDEDALRVSVSPRKAPHTELLTYDVINQTNESADLVLRWEELEVPIPLTFNTHELVLQSMRDELRSTPGFSWQGWNQAAQYCIQNNINLEEGYAWSRQATGRNQNFTTLATQSQLLSMMDKPEEAALVMESALKVATKQEMNAYGYQLINLGKHDEAIAIFEQNVKAHKDDPNLYDSLGEGYYIRNADGDHKKAIKALKKSLSMNPIPQVRANSLRLLAAMDVDITEYEVQTARNE
ncbi:DUF2911 domain-containing protein [Pontibacter sp. G13]|uniref:DUF2911 domain-containing protein n=1 Tax=Pontibacter sp. G13 TaxID=3074898 RepID=UPI00288C48B9|nr:DUF2911 domain-containing protein [Pontibacter sp. G13]WNJ17054.1 DUF2911 domain-containing protein [Pontibacter sp. G13]